MLISRVLFSISFFILYHLYHRKEKRIRSLNSVRAAPTMTPLYCSTRQDNIMVVGDELQRSIDVHKSKPRLAVDRPIKIGDSTLLVPEHGDLGSWVRRQFQTFPPNVLLAYNVQFTSLPCRRLARHVYRFASTLSLDSSPRCAALCWLSLPTCCG